MPHYYFDLHSADFDAEDPEGADLPDLHAARVQAIRGIRSILSDEISSGKIDLRGHIAIRDEGGLDVMDVFYAEAVELRLP